MSLKTAVLTYPNNFLREKKERKKRKKERKKENLMRKSTNKMQEMITPKGLALKYFN